MFRISYLTLPLLVGILAFAQTPNFETLNRSIVKVRTHRDHPTDKEDEDETGTGFVVAASGGVLRIITASHVVIDASKVEVTFNSDKVTGVPVRVLPNVSDNLDLAVLELRGGVGVRVPPNIPVLSWVPKDGLRVSQHLWTVNGDWEPVPNTIIRLDHTGNPQLFEYTQVSVGQGYSGAPVFNDDGLLLGIHVREAARSDYKLSIAIKIESALETLDALGYSRNSFNSLVIARAVQHPESLPVKAGIPAATPKQIAPQQVFWRNLKNNQLYQLRVDAGHMYISQRGGAVVADLSFGKNKKGVQGYFGNSSLSTCPGSGYMEILGITETRVEGRIEERPAAANVKCGGVFGMMRNLVPVTFIREQ